jgi:SAM-dependent methyltransferase
MDVFGNILLEQHQVEQPIHFVIERDDGHIDVLNAQGFFHSYPMWPSLETEFLAKLQSPILDVGCGAGRHAMYLQDLGYEVTGMDIAPGALEVCKKRGVQDVVMGSVFEFPSFKKKFESILLFGHNISLGGSQDGLRSVLKELSDITSASGVVIGNFASPIPTDNPTHLKYHESNAKKGLPIGLIRFCIRYKNQRSEWINWYLPTLDEFREIIDTTDWEIQLQKEEAESNTHYIMLQKS